MMMMMMLISTCSMASGPYFGFGGAAWMYRPNVQALSTVLPFHFHHTDVRMQRTIAHHLGALKNDDAIRSLEDYYTTELPTIIHPNSTAPPQAPFPYITSYMPIGAAAQQSFMYASQRHDKLLFFARFLTARASASNFPSNTPR
jgi:hypothetical protein